MHTGVLVFTSPPSNPSRVPILKEEKGIKRLHSPTTLYEEKHCIISTVCLIDYMRMRYHANKACRNTIFLRVDSNLVHRLLLFLSYTHTPTTTHTHTHTHRETHHKMPIRN